MVPPTELLPPRRRKTKSSALAAAAAASLSTSRRPGASECKQHCDLICAETAGSRGVVTDSSRAPGRRSVRRRSIV